MSRALARSGRAVDVALWMLVDLVARSGLRVAEVADLSVGDVMVQEGRRSVLVRCGKGGKRRVVRIGADLASHVVAFLSSKARRAQPARPADPLLWSAKSRGRYSRRALQLMFKRAAKHAGLHQDFSIHCLRHTYAVHLYKKSGFNLRLVQKQLGHSSIRTTEVYADVINPDADRALDGLYRIAK